VIAAAVAVVDLTLKELARVLISGADPIPLAGPFQLALVHNHASAFGISLGSYTGAINAVATFAALTMTIMVVRSLTEVDSWAPIALGLIAGAALGNLTSMLIPPAGVPDYFSVNYGAGNALVLNAADLAAYAGLALIVRSAVLLGRAMRAPIVKDVRTVSQPARAFVGEIQVPIAVVVERPPLGDNRRSPALPRGENEAVLGD
jgi:signal peptidase II